MTEAPIRTFDQALLLAWQDELKATPNPIVKEQCLPQEQEVLRRFAAHYQQLKILRRRVRRSLQRQCKRSLAGIALLIALGQAPALAATINVGGTCTLIRAIVAANNDTATPGCKKGSGADTIVLPLRSTQTLTAVNNTNYGPTGLPTVRTPITIQGNSSTIRRVKSAPRFHIFSVGKTGKLTFQKTTISGGSGFGGLFNYRGTLNVINSTISGNAGCGITHDSGSDRTNYGRSTVTGSTISGNTGCGLLTYQSASFVVTNSTISNNGGNGLDVAGYNSARVANCTISGNGGSGISLFYATATIINSTITGNAGTEHPISGAFTGKLGGGVFVDQRSSVSIINSTISGNSVNGGGGLYLARWIHLCYGD
jgi:hypothetical protein